MTIEINDRVKKAIEIKTTIVSIEKLLQPLKLKLNILIRRMTSDELSQLVNALKERNIEA